MPPFRAVICDIYGTLLHPGPPPPDAGEMWLQGCKDLAGQKVSLTDFQRIAAEAIASQHEFRRAAGESFPEVDWLAVVRTVLPGINAEEQAVSLSHLHAACSRTCTAMPGAVPALDALHRADVLLGIASNAQHYTRRELQNAGFDLRFFDPAICFLSGDHGFAKPSPRVFTWINTRLTLRGITPQETVMVGDSMEKDILPASSAGWRTVWMGGESGLSWNQWMEALKIRNQKSE